MSAEGERVGGRELHRRRPDWLVAFEDSDWHYYVPDEGHGFEDAVGPLGEPDEFEHERVFMREVRASSLDWYDGSTTTTGKDGRFEPVMCWIECAASHPDAVAWFGVRYA